MESDLVEEMVMGKMVRRRKGISKGMRRIPKMRAGVSDKYQLSRAN